MYMTLEERAQSYNRTFHNYPRVVKVLKTDGFLCWLDQVLAMYRKDIRSRVLSIFQKV